MATGTAIITAGGSHPNHGGISPMATLTLWENSRPAWHCELVEEQRAAVWVPFAPETIFDDGLLTLAAVSIRDRQVLDLLDGFSREKWDVEHVDIAEVIGEPSDELRAAVQEAVSVAKLVITVLPESSALGQLAVLESLASDVELCLPTYWRRSSHWLAETEVGGQLP